MDEDAQDSAFLFSAKEKWFRVGDRHLQRLLVHTACCSQCGSYRAVLCGTVKVLIDFLVVCFLCDDKERSTFRG